MKSRSFKRAFTLIELLTVLAVLSLLLAILVPSLSKAKRKVRALISACNQREIVGAVSLYSVDNNDRFPDSVATLGTSRRWSWREPMVLTGFKKRSPNHHRSVSEYLRGYTEKADTFFCTSAPKKYEYLQEAWDAGDDWDNPDPGTGLVDPVFGTFCLYWNYRGYLVGKNRPFVGPQTAAGRKYESKLLVSDYLGFGHWRNELTYGTREAFGSCEPFSGAGTTPGTAVSTDFWSKPVPREDAKLHAIKVKLHAGYTDGHVESYTPESTTTMKVSVTPDGMIPYPDSIGPGGDFFIPLNGQ